MQDKILIVDDKKVNRIILERYLQQVGYTNIFQADDGVKALELVNEITPDLILLDIVMPIMNGYEVCKAIKQNEQTRMIPIIMVTALNDRESKIKCIEYGADDILNKPVDSSELTARVRSLITVTRYYKQILDLNNQLLNSVKKAQKIQQALLPNTYPQYDGLFFDTLYQPAEYVGGDTFNIFPVNSCQVGLYIADVTGHQFDAALLTVFIKEVISSYSRQINFEKGIFEPAKCLTILEESFKKENFPLDIFITIYVAIYDVKKKTFTYSSAGFAQAPIVYGGDEIRELPCSGKMIMGLDVDEQFSEYTTTLNAGEGVMFFTDGLIEQLNGDLTEQFGVERLIKTLQGISEDDKQQAIVSVINELKQFANTENFADDITMINMYLSK